MGYTIRIAGGTSTELDGVVPAQRELVYDETLEKLYIGDGIKAIPTAPSVSGGGGGWGFWKCGEGGGTGSGRVGAARQARPYNEMSTAISP